MGEGRTLTIQPENKKTNDDAQVLRSRDDMDRRYVSKKTEEEDLFDSVDTSIRGLEDYIRKSKEILITVARNCTGDIKFKKATITWK